MRRALAADLCPECAGHGLQLLKAGKVWRRAADPVLVNAAIEAGLATVRWCPTCDGEGTTASELEIVDLSKNDDGTPSDAAIADAEPTEPEA